MQPILTEYDYIIGGAGLAGLTLAFYLSKSEQLQHKKVLIIDPNRKDKNDRTWCFWSHKYLPHKDLPINHVWQKGKVIFNDDTIKETTISPYSYYQINGIDYYHWIKSEIAKNQNIHWLHEKIDDFNQGKVRTERRTILFSQHFFKAFYTANELSPSEIKGHFMWQHFYGQIIETKEDFFNPESFTYMDFRTPQPDNGLGFHYILPTAKNKALVEFTLFSQDLLPKEDYKSILQTFIETKLKPGPYSISEEEYNKIPMTTALNEVPKGKIIPIGTLAGTVKPSTGYAFLRTHQQLQEIIKQLESGANPKTYFSHSRFRFYDEVLMNVILTGKKGGLEVFESLFAQNKLQHLFAFLDEETNLFQDLKIMNSVPKKAFIKAVIEELT